MQGRRIGFKFLYVAFYEGKRLETSDWTKAFLWEAGGFSSVDEYKATLSRGK